MAGRLTTGTIVTTTLSAPSGVLASQNGMNGISKAWVNFNGQGGATIRGSFNVSSVTYNSTGVYTINFTTTLADANYGMAGMVASNTTGGIGWAVNVYDGGSYTPTASALQIATGTANGAPSELCSRTVSVCVFD